MFSQLPSVLLVEDTLNKCVQIDSTCLNYKAIHKEYVGCNRTCIASLWSDGLPLITMATNLPHTIEAKS